MKKTLALILSMLMLLSGCITVFAEDPVPESGSITIKNPQEDASGNPVTYKAYKIFDLAYEETNPAVPTTIPGGKPYSYYIGKDSSWLNTVLAYATADDILWDHDGNPSTDPVPKRGTGLALDPVYDSKGDLKGYNVSYDANYDPAKFAKTLKAALKATDSTKVTPTAAETVEFDDEAKAKGLEFGYYLVDPSMGALASLTSTDPDVVISDKNELPKVDKVILEDEVENRPIFGETDPKYVAYELFHKTDSNVEWGAGVKASDFNAALCADSDLDSLYVSAYGEPAYSGNPGSTAARKWSDLYKAEVEANYIAAAKDYLTAAAGSIALNPVNAGCTYIVEMIQGGVSKGFAILTADGTTGLLPLDGAKFSDGTNTTDYVKPDDLVKAELEGLTNEVKATGASIGETVNFKLVTKVPDMTGYKEYFFVMNDTMDEGLTFEADTIEVYLNKNQNDNPVEAADKLVKDTDYTVQVNPVYKLDSSGNKIEIKDPNTGLGTGEYETTGQTEIRIIFMNMIQYWNSNEDTDLEGEPITVKYSATVNQKAILNGPNKNTAFMEFSNDPTIDVDYTPDVDDDDPSYDPRDDKYKHPDGTDITEDLTGKGPESSTETYVAEITLTKIDGADPDKALSGAKFKITGESYQVILYKGDIYKKDSTGTWYLLKDGTYTETKPGDTVESTYTEFDGKIMEYVVDEEKTEPAVNWYFYNTEDSKYELITADNLAQVPANAVMYTKQYTENLYKAKTEPTGGWAADATIDDKYEAVPVSSAAEKAAAEALQDAGTKFYVKGTKSAIDDYDDPSVTYIKVEELIDKTAAEGNSFQTEGYTDKNGKLTMTGLGAGTYTIEELIAPEGYNLLQAPITVVVTFDATTKEFTATVDGAAAGYTADTNTINFNVINNQGTELPETGGMGTVLFITIGAVMFMAAGIILTTKKRLYNEG